MFIINVLYSYYNYDPYCTKYKKNINETETHSLTHTLEYLCLFSFSRDAHLCYCMLLWPPAKTTIWKANFSYGSWIGSTVYKF